MRKEILLAIFVGVTLGLMITFGIYQNKENAKSGQNTTTDQLINNPTSTKSAQTVQDPQLVINSPEEDLLTNAEELIVSGNSAPDSFVIVLINDAEQISNTDASGNFSLKVKLVKGGNLIEINSINEDGKQISKQRSVVYEP